MNKKHTRRRAKRQLNVADLCVKERAKKIEVCHELEAVDVSAWEATEEESNNERKRRNSMELEIIKD